MAALAERHPVEVVPLRRVSAADLDWLLREEAVQWRQQLRWDFSPSAELVRQYVASGSLSGFALAERSQAGARVVGYAYYVQDEHKALIGDLYVAQRAASRDNEQLLLDAILSEAQAIPGMRRVECQLMMLRHMEELARTTGFPGSQWMRAFTRDFMAAEIGAVRMPERSRLASAFDVVAWSEALGEESARLIAESYDGHIDSQINDQYRTVAGARRFLSNIVQYPGCGRFLPEGSVAAVDWRTGALCGISLASVVAEGVGHITQICVATRVRGRGLGRELMQRSLDALADAGCGEVSLTVTESNVSAVRLYEQFGFRVMRRFSANVWEWS